MNKSFENMFTVATKVQISHSALYTDGQKKRFIRILSGTLSKASGLFEFIDFCLSDMLANIYEYFKLLSVILFPSE